MPDKESRHDKKARRVALDAMLTMFTADEVAMTALRLAPETYREVSKLDSVAKRAALLVEIAQRENLLDELLDHILNANMGEVDQTSY